MKCVLLGHVPAGHSRMEEVHLWKQTLLLPLIGGDRQVWVTSCLRVVAAKRPKAPPPPTPLTYLEAFPGSSIFSSSLCVGTHHAVPKPILPRVGKVRQQPWLEDSQSRSRSSEKPVLPHAYLMVCSELPFPWQQAESCLGLDRPL